MKLNCHAATLDSLVWKPFQTTALHSGKVRDGARVEIERTYMCLILLAYIHSNSFESREIIMIKRS